MLPLKCLFLYLCCVCVFGISLFTKHRLKQNGMRRDKIAHLSKSKSKMLDLILNQAVNEIINSISSTRTRKRKKIESNTRHSDEELKPINKTDIPENVRESLKIASDRLKNTDPLLDPFVGQNDPYRYEHNTNDTTFDSVKEFIKSIETKSAPQEVEEDVLLSNHRHNNNANSFDKKIKISENLEKPVGRNEEKEKLYLENLEEKSSFEEFRKNDQKEEGKSSKSKVDNNFDTKDLASEMLPLDNGYDIILLKDEENNDEVKLDEPNVHFDVKVNTPNSRDKVVKNLKDVVNVLSRLKFGKNKGDEENNSKNENSYKIIVGDKRGSPSNISINGSLIQENKTNSFNNMTHLIEVQNVTAKDPATNAPTNSIETSSIKLTDSKLPEVIPEIKNHMYPVHGSYFLQHDGNIYKLEKVDNIHNGLDDSEQLRDLSRLTEQTSQKITDQAQTRSQQKTLPSEKEYNQYQQINPPNKTYIIRHGEETYEITQSEKGEGETTPIVSKDVETAAGGINTYEIKHNNKIFRVTEVIASKKDDRLTPGTTNLSIDDTVKNSYVNNQEQTSESPVNSNFTRDAASLEQSHFEDASLNKNPSFIDNQISDNDAERRFEDTSLNKKTTSVDNQISDSDAERRFEDTNLKNNQSSVDNQVSDNDDDYVTYVFRTKNNTTAYSTNNTSFEEEV
ncbi:uncharacterized protein LOC130622859 [Hydractinia symbiolongicarpus]|uniref:uncharacterized protein LOC130622859 n=1 Tax=Hydractinia symbiolongicarpus TaxID=13093 RepID=UPI00254E3E61|nr:uncharacterized protein LOC130622859 [Hydractinia symbiolongicarpus]